MPVQPTYPAASARLRARQRHARSGTRTARSTSTSSPASPSCRSATRHPAPDRGVRAPGGDARPRLEPVLVGARRRARRAAARGCASSTAAPFFCNSGAEANEAAIKLARRRGRARGGPDKHQIVCLEGSFHGRTLGDARRRPGRARRRSRSSRCRRASRTCRRTTSTRCAAAVGPRTAAVLLEPVQGEGGVHPLDVGFLALARELCDRHDALLICDEVQTGIGRCGAWLASRRLGVEPDAVTLAKGLALGHPDRRARDARSSRTASRPATTPRPSAPRRPSPPRRWRCSTRSSREDLIGNAERVGTYLARAARRACPASPPCAASGLLLAVELRAGDAPGVAAPPARRRSTCSSTRSRRRRCGSARRSASASTTPTGRSRRSRACWRPDPPCRAAQRGT